MQQSWNRNRMNRKTRSCWVTWSNTATSSRYSTSILPHSSQIIWHPELCFRFPVYQGCVNATPNTSRSFLRANNVTFDFPNCIRTNSFFHLLVSVSMITNLKKLIQTPSQFSHFFKKKKERSNVCICSFGPVELNVSVSMSLSK